MTQPVHHLTHGFQLQREQFIPELAATARIYRHAKTGGRLLSLASADENKVFGIALRTPPSDHTGLPHILEHSVLCGSEKYPVKEPFVELIKGSLNTFLNALTFPDKTCYPVASANLQDFYNLVDVYLDAVFHPRLTENTLRQEGWHYDIEKPQDELAIKGVVYNEMKGAYSSPDSLLSEHSQRALYPDTCYGMDSGGDPERIPDLTFEQFMDFHRRLYHPANAYAFFSGDDDPEARLRIMDEAFSRFEALPGGPDSEVGVQKKFDAPRRFVHFYAADAPEDMEDPEGDEEGEGGAPGNSGPKAMCTVNFGLPQIVDLPADQGADLSLALNVLEHVLIGLPSSPLRKALVDSGLGEDITGGGLETDLRQMSFTVGLKGMAAASAEGGADKVEALVLSTLADLEREGLHADDIAAAINSVEFDLRENNTGSYPRGLALFFESLATWLYDGDPLMLLPFEGPLARLKARLAAGEKVFEALIREHFLGNTHRALVLLRPDTGLGRRREEEEKARLAAIRAAMSEERIAELVEQTLTLRELQEAPDSPEDLARIPRLGLSDLPPENAVIPQGCGCKNGAKLYLHDLPTGGIVYLDLGLDLSAVPDRLLPLVPILGRALFEMGTRKTGFVDLTRKIAMTTGGLWGQAFLSSVRTEEGDCAPDPAARLFLRGKATAANVPALLGILSEVLEAPNFGATPESGERLAKIILESKARREQRLIPAGHTLAAARLKARTGAAQAMADAMHGVSGFLWLRELAARVQSNPEETCAAVAADLRELLSLMLCRRTLVAGLTAGGAQLSDAVWRLENMVATLPGALPEGAVSKAPRAIPDLPEREGLVLPAQVNYAAWGANLRELDAQPGLASGVVCKHLRAGYLWERVRVQGGAYGAGVSYSRTSGNLVFSSYRDPNTGRTVEAFQGVAPYLAGLEIDSAELEKSIVGTIGDLDHYMLPDAKGFTALARQLTGESEEHRQRVRECVLAATAEDFRDFGRSVEAAAKQGRVVIAGGREALEQSGLDLTLTRLL